MNVIYVAMIAMSLLFSSTDAFTSETKPYDIELVDYGIYESHNSERIKEATSPSGYIQRISDIFFIEKTDTINATIGKRFGVQYVIHDKTGGENVDVEIVIHLPPDGIKNPEILKPFHKITSNVNALIGEINTSGYLFDEDFEIVPGTWRFELSIRDTVLLKKEFVVVSE